LAGQQDRRKIAEKSHLLALIQPAGHSSPQYPPLHPALLITRKDNPSMIELPYLSHSIIIPGMTISGAKTKPGEIQPPFFMSGTLCAILRLS
jgi:hypothetical protein